MIKQTKVSITKNDRERLFWLQSVLFQVTNKKHSQEDTLHWMLNICEEKIKNDGHQYRNSSE